MNYGECIGQLLTDFDTHFKDDDEIEEIIKELVDLLSILNDRINRIVDKMDGGINE